MAAEYVLSTTGIPFGSFVNLLKMQINLVEINLWCCHMHILGYVNYFISLVASQICDRNPFDENIIKWNEKIMTF